MPNQFARFSPLAGKTAVVTGAAGGIGKAVVLQLLDAGVNVYATDLASPLIDAPPSADGGAAAGKLRVARLDVTSAADWAEAMAEATRAFGRIDWLFNIAGIMRAAWVEETPLADVDAVVDVNLKGVILGTRFAAAAMIAAGGGGHIINVSSMLGLVPGPGMAVYVGAKYGVRGFTLSAAMELAEHHIAVSLVCPDRTDTGLFDFPNAAGPQAALAYAGPPPLSPESVAARIVREVLISRPLMFCIPRHRGLALRFAEFAPRRLMRHLFAFLAARGTRRQRRSSHPATIRNPPNPALQTVEQTVAPPPAAPAAPAAPVAPGAADIAEMFAAARQAAAALRASDVRQRLTWLAGLKRHVIAERDAIARRISEQTGKPLLESLALEVMPLLATLTYLEKNAARILRTEHGPRLPFQFGKHFTICYEPLGVVLVLAPYNYPFGLALLPAIEAFVAGNAVIIKPSEACPLAEVWTGLLEAAALPQGAIQICHLEATRVHELVAAGPDRIHLTGGPTAGARVTAMAAEKLIPVSAELGGKDVAIVLADADLHRCIECLTWALLVHRGQTCAAIKRILVQDAIYETFCAALSARIAQAAASLPARTAAATPENRGTQRDAAARALAIAALQQGARILVPDSLTDTYPTLEPVVVADVSPAMQLWQEETWGPVLAIGRFHQPADALAAANDCRFGLAASIWTRDLQSAAQLAAQLEVGAVSINNALATMANPALPYGGTKQSGWGRQRGAHGLRGFCNIKTVLTDRGKSLEPFWLPYSPMKYRALSDLVGGFFGRGLRGRGKALAAMLRLRHFMRRSKKD